MVRMDPNGKFICCLRVKACTERCVEVWTVFSKKSATISNPRKDLRLFHASCSVLETRALAL